MFKVHQEMYMYQLHNKMFPLHVRMPHPHYKMFLLCERNILFKQNCSSLNEKHIYIASSKESRTLTVTKVILYVLLLSKKNAIMRYVPVKVVYV